MRVASPCLASALALATFNTALAQAEVMPAETAQTEETKHSDWAFSFTPYLWVAGVEVETTLPDLPPSTPPETSRFDTRIAGGAMFTAEARYKDIGLWWDFAWLRLDTDATSPRPAFTAVNLESDFIHSTAALSYRLPLEGRLRVEVLAGARVWYVHEDLSATGNVLFSFNAKGDNTWVDPIVGADLSYQLTPKWSLVAKGRAGGQEGVSDLSWEAMGGVSYRFSNCCSGAFGYRYLHEDYSRKRFTLNTDIQGFIAGVMFHF